MAIRFSLSNKSSSSKWSATAAVLAAVVMAGLFAPTSAMADDIVFSHVDPKGDDKGTGRYVYPKNPVYNDGAFDIRKFEVIDLGDKVEFRITIDSNIVKEHESFRDSRGWVLQLFDIYIDKDHTPFSGRTDALPGRAVSFDPSSAWEQVVVISPHTRETLMRGIKEKAEEIEFMFIGKKLIIPSYPKVKKRTFIARVAKEEIGNPQPWWGYQVLLLGNSDSESVYSFMNKEVFSFAGEMEFGGGSDFRGNPNMLDLLDGDGHFNQYEALAKYVSKPDPRKNKFAVIKHLYKAERKPAVKEEEKKLTGLPVSDRGPDAGVRDIPSVQDIPVRTVNREPEQVRPMEKPPEAAPGRIVKDLGEFSEELLSDTPAGKCVANMLGIHRSAVNYYRHHPDDENITLLDLIYEGYLDEKPTCPSGGRYVVFGEDTGDILVRCINPTGVEHGIFPREGAE